MIVYSSIFVVLLLLTILNALLDDSLCSQSAKNVPSQGLTSERKKYVLIYLLLPVILLFAVSSLRYNVGKDYRHHLDIFEWIKQSGPNSVYVEKGYSYFNALISAVGLPGETVFIVGGLLVCGSLATIAYWFVPCRCWSLFVIFYFFGGAFFSSLNLVRQYYAISLCVFSAVALYKKRWLISALLFILAALFHSSAIIFIALPIIAYGLRNKSFRIVVLVVYLFSLLLVFVDVHQAIIAVHTFLPSRWVHYLEDSQFLNRDKMAMLKLVVPNLTFLVFSSLYFNTRILSRRFDDKLLDKSSAFSGDNIIMSGLILFVATQNAFYGVMVLTRFSEYFWIFYFIAIAKLIYTAKQRSMKRLIEITYLFYFVLLTIVTIFMKNGNSVIPYTFLFAPNYTL